jgi:hypothetical protein
MSNQPPERRNEKVDSLQIFVCLGTKNAAPLSPEPGGPQRVQGAVYNVEKPPTFDAFKPRLGSTPRQR